MRWKPFFRANQIHDNFELRAKQTWSIYLFSHTRTSYCPRLALCKLKEIKIIWRQFLRSTTTLAKLQFPFKRSNKRICFNETSFVSDDSAFRNIVVLSHSSCTLPHVTDYVLRRKAASPLSPGQPARGNVSATGSRSLSGTHLSPVGFASKGNKTGQGNRKTGSGCGHGNVFDSAWVV